MTSTWKLSHHGVANRIGSSGDNTQRDGTDVTKVIQAIMVKAESLPVEPDESMSRMRGKLYDTSEFVGDVHEWRLVKTANVIEVRKVEVKYFRKKE